MAVRVIMLCFLLLFFSLAAAADTLTGKVVKITDGDVLYVCTGNLRSSSRNDQGRPASADTRTAHQCVVTKSLT